MNNDYKIDRLRNDVPLWAEVLDRATRKGRDKDVIAALSDAAGREAVIRAIEAGRYRMQPPKTLYVDKLTGEFIPYAEAERRNFVEVRELYAPSCDMDAVVLAVIAKMYYRLYSGMMHPACVSYREGLGVGGIIRNKVIPQLKEGMHGYKLDLSKYFDSVKLKSIESTLKAMDTGSAVDRLVWDMYHDDRVTVNGKEIRRYMSIRQGNAFGVLLANLVLRDVDRTISENYDVVYYRYSDDVLILGPDADEALARFREMIVFHGLTLNPKKIEWIDASKPFTFLGLQIFGTSVDIAKKSLDRVKRKIRLITKPRKTVKTRDRKVQARKRHECEQVLYGHDRFGHSWAEYFFECITPDSSAIRILDDFVKEHLRGVYTGRQGGAWFTHNCHRTSMQEMKDEVGYTSVMHLFRLYKAGRDAYRSWLLRIGI